MYRHYEDFQEGYGREHQSDFGYFRHDVDETISKFINCGDPRLGVVRYECEDCQTRLYLPFSCKTRLFCPSCHAKFSELWVEQLMSEVIRPKVPHRFWIQTHGGELNWNCHLHALITDGIFDYSNPNEVKFHPFFFWDLKGMTELFRRLLLKRLHREGVLTQEVVENMMSWPHSGFHVYAGEAFRDKDFIATLTQHIPNRYQNMRRYAGFYAANVRLRIRRAKAEENKDALPEIRMAGPIRLHWANRIAKIFGENPIQCPRCHQDLKLKGFLLKTNLMFKEIQVLSRAPPPKEFPRYRDLPDKGKISLEPEEGWARPASVISGIKDISEEFFDQSVNW